MAKKGFVSEAGAHGFRFDGPEDTHFSLTAVLVEEEHKREVEEGFRRIRERHFPDGKASFGDGRGIVQTRGFLEELKGLDFSFHALPFMNPTVKYSKSNGIFVYLYIGSLGAA